MMTRPANREDLEAWVRLRHALWPNQKLDDLRVDAENILASDDDVCFLLVSGANSVVGFSEGAVHQGPQGMYGHVEGWYVAPESRHQGYGNLLISGIEQWCLHRAIFILTSDTTSAYPLSPRAHAGCGFREIYEFKIFLKDLRDTPVANSDDEANAANG